jgi:hypothetical protein
MKKLILPFLLFLSFQSFAQFTITGKVVDQTDKKPVLFATAFLNNTSAAAPTNDNGEFKLKNIRPGHYQLIITFIGYETYKTNIIVDDNMDIPVINLVPSNRTLTQVQISAKFKLSWHFDDFKKEFLGTTDFAKECRILNPEVLHFDYDKQSEILMVTSNEFLKVENDALGYKINYKIDKFTKDENTGSIFYEGPSYFEEMKGTPEQMQQWQKNRMHAYRGSFMEFLRSLLSNKMEVSGYQVNKLLRIPNPYYDRNKDGKANMYIQKFIDTPLTRREFLVSTDQKGLFALKGVADTCLYVRYNAKKDLVSVTEKDIYRPGNMIFAKVTSIIAFNSRYATFDYNGIITNPASISMEGYFGEGRVAYQLPDNFEPTN